MINRLKIKELITNSAFFLIIVGLSLLPFIWLPKGYYINSEDQLFMNYDILVDKAAYAWTNFSAYGLPATAANHSLIIPNAIFYSAARGLGFSMNITQKIFMTALIFLLLTSFWLFASLLTKRKHIILLGIFSYFLNFYISVSLTYTGKMFQLILTPLLFYITYKFLETKKSHYVFIHFLCFYIFQAIFTNLTQLFALLPIYIFASIYYCIQYSKKIMSIVGTLIVLISITIPIYIYHALVYYFSLYVNLNSVMKTATFTSFYSYFYKVFQFRGIWWEDISTSTGLPYYLWSSFFNSPIIVFASFSLLLITLYIFLIKNKISKQGLFFLIIYLFFLALSTGFNFSPTIYKRLFDDFPFFYIFREPWPKFTPFVIFSFSSIIIIAFEKLNINRKVYKFLYLFTLLIIILKGSIFFSSDFYFKWKMDIARLPQYWIEYQNWSRNQKDKHILPIPFYKSRTEFEYSWYPNKIGNTDIELPFVLSASNVFRYYDDADLFSLISSTSIGNKSFDFIKIGKIDYILLQDDVVTLNSQISQDWIKNAINIYAESKPLVTFGNKLHIYKIKEKYQVPSIFVPLEYSTIKQSKNFLSAKVLSKMEPYKVVFPILENKSKISQLNYIGKNLSKINTNITYTKINPTKYKVYLKHVYEIFPLVLEESYNSEWKAYIVNSSQSIPESAHLLVNGFLNSWIINPQVLCKNNLCKTNNDKTYDIELVIEYTPQRLFSLVYNLNLAILIFSILSLMYLYCKKIIIYQK